MLHEDVVNLLRWKHGDPSAPEPKPIPEQPTGANILRLFRCECGKEYDRFQFDAWYAHLATCPYAQEEEG